MTDPHMTAAQYLDACRPRGIRLDLAPMRALAAALGQPQQACKTLLVAGTNGKGSVVACVEAVLRAGGQRTGRFTSPPLRCIEEQITVAGHAVTAADLDAAMHAVQAAATAAAVAPSSFEALTAAAFVHFRRQQVDVAVLEAGLGAQDDATNVADPVASAIVSIARDHERFLGHSLASIARAKAGVLRPGRTTVLGPLPEEAQRAVRERAHALAARLVFSTDGARLADTAGGLDVTTPSRTYRGLRFLPGEHQRDNLLVALRLLEAAAEAGLHVDWHALSAAVTGLHWPGRLQWIDARPPLLLDGAHNPAGAAALAAWLRTRGAPFVLVFGAMEDKDVEGMAAALFPQAAALVFTRADASPRAATPERLRERTRRYAGAAHLEHDVAQALDAARRRALDLAPDAQAPVVIAGSLALVGAVLTLLEKK